MTPPCSKQNRRFHIVTHRSTNCATGAFEYLIHWEGVDSSHNTWEPEGHVAPDSVAAYWLASFRQRGNGTRACTRKNRPMSADMMKARAEARRRKGPEKGHTTSASLPRRATPPVYAPVCVVEDRIARGLSLSDDGDITEFCMEMEKYNAQYVHV